MKVTFVTGNIGKWKIAKDIFEEYGINLFQEKMETPEIQSLDVEEVANYFAIFAAKKCGKPVIKSDVGHYIKALNGFPGPLIKFINQTLDSEDILRMMHGKEDRRVILKECLSFAQPNKKNVVFISEEIGQIAKEVVGEGSTMDKILILEGFNKPIGACGKKEIFEHFKSKLHIYHEAARYIIMGTVQEYIKIQIFLNRP